MFPRTPLYSQEVIIFTDIANLLIDEITVKRSVLQLFFHIFDAIKFWRLFFFSLLQQNNPRVTILGICLHVYLLVF